MERIRQFDQVTADWLSGVTGARVAQFSMQLEESNWARHARIAATYEDGTRRNFWLKVCLHAGSGRSEVDYYVRDYADLPNAPLLTCYDAAYEPGVGYHILLDDLSAHYKDRKHVPPTLHHGVALAEAVARLHRRYWESGSARKPAEWESYFENLRVGIRNMERAAGRPFSERFEVLAAALADRWSHPVGMTMLHGDINPTNVLTPKSADAPVFFLDRQPLDGKTPYGLALYDLAYAIAPWWPRTLRLEHEEAILRTWFETLAQPSYSWEQALADWSLSVEHCLCVPADWCIDPVECDSMRSLWEWQLGNLDG